MGLPHIAYIVILNKSLSQSCPEISVNPLNINSTLVETFSENQRGINVLQIKEDLSALIETSNHIY